MKITNIYRDDGFGSQFQTIIYCILYADYYKYEYIYRPITKIGYYDDDKLYNNINKYLNLENKYKNYYDIENKDAIIVANFHEHRDFIENNLDYFLESESIKSIKNLFWKNKIRTYNNSFFNIAIHIRVWNNYDINANMLRNYNNFNYYSNLINKLKIIYKDKNYLFHIISQGNISDFNCFNDNKIILHIDTEREQDNFFNSFLELVSADVLITNNSSFSYSAALLCDGIIYYENCCHKPANKWIKIDQII